MSAQEGVDVLRVLSRAENYCWNSPLEGAVDAAEQVAKVSLLIAELIAAAKEYDEARHALSRHAPDKTDSGCAFVSDWQRLDSAITRRASALAAVGHGHG